MRSFVCLTSIYSLTFPLIKIRSSISQHLHNNFCYFHNGISSSQIMVFISFLENYNFTLLLVQHSGFNKFIISQFHHEQQLPKYYNDTWCTYAPLWLHIPYTLLGRGVTLNAMKQGMEERDNQVKLQLQLRDEYMEAELRKRDQNLEEALK